MLSLDVPNKNCRTLAFSAVWSLGPTVAVALLHAGHDAGGDDRAHFESALYGDSVTLFQ
jgi:hypothetical protein